MVVIGTGWAGSRVARDLDLDIYNLSVISLRNHMVFTPLLPSTTTGIFHIIFCIIKSNF